MPGAGAVHPINKFAAELYYSKDVAFPLRKSAAWGRDDLRVCKGIHGRADRGGAGRGLDRRREILRRKANGEAVREIARSYNVHNSTISRL